MSIRFGRTGMGYDSTQVMVTPDDDWRQVKDVNERRKIQNRLAQRNYRRKIRQRLDELERQTGKRNTSERTKSRNLKPTSKVTKRYRSNSIRTIRSDSDDVPMDYRTPSPELASTATCVSSPAASCAYSSFPLILPEQDYYKTDFGPILASNGVQPSIVTSEGQLQPTQEASIWDLCRASQVETKPSIQPICEEYNGDFFPQIPDPSQNYPTNIAANLNHFHDLSVNYNKIINAAMEINRILNGADGEMSVDESTVPYNKTELWRLENLGELQPSGKPIPMEHHQYIDVNSLREFRDSLVQEENKAVNFDDDGTICYAMHGSLDFWGQNPLSWEIEGGCAYTR